MATKNKTKIKREIRKVRHFSDEFKIKKVKEIEQNLSTIADIKREYGVSKSAIYNWIYKYSLHLKKGVRQVLEMESETLKTKRLREKVSELERIVGQKQLAIDFLDKMIEIGSEELGVDIKKKFSGRLSNGSGNTGTNTTTK